MIEDIIKRLAEWDLYVTIEDTPEFRSVIEILLNNGAEKPMKDFSDPFTQTDTEDPVDFTFRYMLKYKDEYPVMGCSSSSKRLCAWRNRDENKILSAESILAELECKVDEEDVLQLLL